MSPIYRIADIGDSIELKRLNDLFNGYGCNSLHSIEEGLNRNDAETVFIAEQDNKLVGFCCCQLLRSICYSVFYVELTELYVEESFRKRGIGKELVKYAEDWYRQQGIHDFQLFTGKDNLVAQEFYEHIGYRSDNEVLYRKRDSWNKNE